MRVFEFVKTEFLRGFTPEEEPPGAEAEEDASDDELASTENASPADASHIEVRGLHLPSCSGHRTTCYVQISMAKFHTIYIALHE